MTATILSFGRRQPNTPLLPTKMPWQNQDLAELYRVRDRLCAAGLNVDVEAGVTDEGDPWFVYVQAGTDNVVVHIARIDSEIHVINCVTGGAYTGTSFREVSDQMLADAPLALSTQVRRGSNVVLHPSAFLTAFVAAAIMLIDLLEHGRAEAATHHDDVTGIGHHGGWVVTTGASQADPEAAHSNQPAASSNEPTGDVDVLHRRLSKEATFSLQTLSNASPITNFLTVPGTGFTLASSHGFLAEVPGMSASVTLAAGLLAAEFARSFASEVAHSTPENTGLTQGFVSLLNAFVAVESVHAKAPSLPASVSAVVSAPVDPIAIVTHSEADTAHHAVVAEIGSLSAAISVKPVADGWTEHALFAASDAHKTTPLGAGSSVFQSLVQAMAPAQETTRSTPTPSTPAETSAPIPVAVAQTATGTTSPLPATKAEGTKDGSTLDLGWVVSQLVKHTSLADSLQQSFNLSDNSISKTKTPLTDSSSEKTTSSISPDHAAVDTTVSRPELLAPLDTALSVDDPKTETKPVESTIVQAKDGVATLQAGLHETVHYHTGTSLTIKGFVLGEDHLLFDGTAGDTMTKSARADGYDLVLGDVDTGIMRLIGVLADPAISHPQGEQHADA
ncbi:hypothetical protein [Aureimonas sp. AU20]|uniref:hypothetical protein n=1 Tax=Aureimonas sp. AU20 TaxID=1349819 RepID=UPI000720BA28|nr:hypothetical protein [Aureimonas sp. AU20]ALN75766.1 hypothetical protein M673_23725 [Aureimonas sp. AU20]